MASPRTLLGPLTTEWLPPAICSYAMALCETCTTVWQAQTCNQNFQARDWTDCWPPRASYATADPGVMMGWGFYSPGISCPVGFTTVAMATAGGSSGWDVEFSMNEGETAAACCPTGWSITSVIAAGTTAQTCITTARTTSFSTVQCAAGAFTDFSLVRLPQTAEGGAVQSSYIIYAPLYQLNFQASDIPTASSSEGGSASSTGSSPGSSNGATTETAPASSGGGRDGIDGNGTRNGLSEGVKIGVGVGVAVGAIILGLLFFLLFRTIRRRKLAAAGKLSDSEKNSTLHNPKAPEADGQEVKELEAISKPQEILAPVPAELPTSSAAGERASMQSSGQVYELEADTPITTQRPWFG